jgi:iron complex outermembrane receptor protein
VQENPILKGFPIFDLEQIEVLRGPQGTLFGRNTPGGVVKFDSVEARFRLRWLLQRLRCHVQHRNIEGAINIPLGEGWSARFSGSTSIATTFVGNALTGDDDVYEGYDDRAARLQVQYETRISPRYSTRTCATWTEPRDCSAPTSSSPAATIWSLASITRAPLRRRPQPQELNIAGGSVRLRWDFGD